MGQIIAGRLVRTNETQHYLGRTADGDRIYVDLSMDEVNKKVTFTDHKRGTLVWEFAASGSAFAKNTWRDPYRAGQMLDEIEKITEIADGWTMADLQSLLSVWREWHLNGMKGACDHQAARAKEVNYDYDVLHADGPCPAGYRYGSAWLARQLPTDVTSEIWRLMSLPSGDIPRCIRNEGY